MTISNVLRDVTVEQVMCVARRHVARYEKRVEAGERGARYINLEECKQYLALWKSIVEKGATDLSKRQIEELEDAYDAGEFEEDASE